MTYPPRNECPVCYYSDLENGTEFGEICPQCGTMFGVTDAEVPHRKLRSKWLESGSTWWDKIIKNPNTK